MIKSFALSCLLLFICDVATADLSQHFSVSYLALELGAQDIAADSVETAAMREMTAYNRVDLEERISIGWVLGKYAAIEAGLTFFAGYDYQVQPYQNTIHRDIDVFDVLGKLVFARQRFSMFLAAGPAFVYSNVNNFLMNFPPGTFAGVTSDDDEVYPAFWGSSYFIRPKLAAGVGMDLSERFMFGVVVSYIFSQGDFSSSVVSVNGQPALSVDPGSLPALATVGLVIQMRL